MSGVSGEVTAQLSLFGQAALVGAAMRALYDLLRILRRLIPHGILWISAEDLLYWLGFALVEFALMYQRNSGTARGYLFLGTAAGALAYQLTLGRVVVPAFSKMLNFLKKQLKKAKKTVTMGLSDTLHRNSRQK